MQPFLQDIDDGNADIGGEADALRLTGDLQISAMEQVEFLTRLATGGLSLTAESVAAIRDALAWEVAPGFVLYTKTGSGRIEADGDSGFLRWQAGQAERDDRITVFALCTEGNTSSLVTGLRVVTDGIQWTFATFWGPSTANHCGQIEQSEIPISRHLAFWSQCDLDSSPNSLISVPCLVNFLAGKARYQSDCVRINKVARLTEAEDEYGVSTIVTHAGKVYQLLFVSRDSAGKLITKDFASPDK